MLVLFVIISEFSPLSTSGKFTPGLLFTVYRLIGRRVSWRSQYYYYIGCYMDVGYLSLWQSVLISIIAYYASP